MTVACIVEFLDVLETLDRRFGQSADGNLARGDLDNLSSTSAMDIISSAEDIYTRNRSLLL